MSNPYRTPATNAFIKPEGNNEPTDVEPAGPPVPMDWHKCAECGRSIPPTEDVVIHAGQNGPVLICMGCFRT